MQRELVEQKKRKQRELYTWVDSILRDQGESSRNEMPSHTIPKAPDRIRELQPSTVKKNWYDPIFVSIGPYHHGKPELQSGEELKSRFAREYWEGKQLTARAICAKILEDVHELRKFYAEGSTNGYDDLSFTKMMFVDRSFILQFIDGIVNDRQERMMMKIHEIAIVRRNLFLLENQLPFRLLLAQFNNIIKFIISTTPRFIRDPSHNYVILPSTKIYWIEHIAEHPHLLDATWGLYANPDDHVSEHSYGTRYSSRRSATDLSKVRISLRPSEGPELNVTFQTGWAHGILTLPQINIDETTITLLANLVAYENSSAKPPVVSNYVCFLDSIIAHADDVKELKYAGILCNFLSSDEEAVKVIQEMAAGLVPEVPEDTKSFAEVKEKIGIYHTYIHTRIATWRVSEVKRNYFRSPWTAIAVFYAVFAIFLSCIQTYFTVFPRPDKR